jgi:hypothetical protein
MRVFEDRHDLVSYHESGFHAERALALFQVDAEVLSQELCDHNFVVSLPRHVVK